MLMSAKVKVTEVINQKTKTRLFCDVKVGDTLTATEKLVGWSGNYARYVKVRNDRTGQWEEFSQRELSTAFARLVTVEQITHIHTVNKTEGVSENNV